MPFHRSSSFSLAPSFFRCFDAHICSFIAEVQRIATDEYSPSIKDIRRASNRGVSETDLNVNLFSVRVSHVYGQKGDHRKWLHLFEDAASVVFCASISDYDKPGVTDGGQVWPFFPLILICVTIGFVDTASRIACPFRGSRQLALVRADVHHTISNWTTRFHSTALRGAQEVPFAF